MAPTSRGRALSRLWPNDEEMAKRDDDHMRGGSAGHAKSAQWQSAAVSARVPRRRLIARLAAYAFLAFIIVVTLGRLLGVTGSGSSSGGGNGRRLSPDEDDLVGGISRFDMPSSQRPPVMPPKGNSLLDAVDSGDGVDMAADAAAAAAAAGPEKKAKTYGGPVKFPSLGRTLHAISKTLGGQPKNRNVLFAAASLPSAATVLPMACQMAMERQNYVHFAFFGRSEIPLKELLLINGIDDECQLILHDARPDFIDISTEQRMMISTARALYHIHTYMHPQAILIDSTTAEENYFLFGARDQVRSMMYDCSYLARSSMVGRDVKPLISVTAWDKVHVDILIHAPPEGTGNLKRLLGSLSKADLGAMSVPHITIELPNVIETHVERVLGGFHWPPIQRKDPSAHPNMLSLRHRIPRQRLTEEESSVRFLESFWPTSSLHSYVLVLSPNTEVGPQFFHYLKYTLLHHRHSNAAKIQDWNAKMMGISFTSPTTLLDGSRPLIPPPESDDQTAMGDHFLWQAPSSDAAIFPADKWIELHGFVSNILEKQYAAGSTPAILARKEVGKKYPSWLEHVLQLSRLRGYFTVYPGRATSNTVVGVHSDLPNVPEEYGGDEEAELLASSESEGGADQATAVIETDSRVDILRALPQNGNLPNVHNLPLLSWDGRVTGLDELEGESLPYVTQFRREVGECDVDSPKPPAHRLAGDFFCKSQQETI